MVRTSPHTRWAPALKLRHGIPPSLLVTRERLWRLPLLLLGINENHLVRSQHQMKQSVWSKFHISPDLHGIMSSARSLFITHGTCEVISWWSLWGGGRWFCPVVLVNLHLSLKTAGAWTFWAIWGASLLNVNHYLHDSCFNNKLTHIMTYCRRVVIAWYAVWNIGLS